jgi:CheY-like chemotaxis protein
MLLKTLKILLIEDDVIEVMKFKRVLSNLRLNHTIIEANNGEEALELLNIKGQLPNIILLDLNMPRIDGIEFLSRLKKNDKLKHIPAVILTTSNNFKDLKKCFEIGIAGYILKPLKYEEYMVKIESLLTYWSMNELIIK